MNNHLELPWSMKDTIENMKDLKQMLSERIKKANYDGKGETDAEEIKFDFERAILALEKQIGLNDYLNTLRKNKKYQIYDILSEFALEVENE